MSPRGTKENIASDCVGKNGDLFVFTKYLLTGPFRYIYLLLRVYIPICDVHIYRDEIVL